jgi:tetratricopeptide (TPR) repeat protein
MSLAGMAAAVHFTKGYLSKIENGKARATQALARLCDRALNAEGELLALIESVEASRRSAGGLAGLPDTTRHFVGRAEQLSTLVTALREPDLAPVSVITGMAGVGKTSLAITAAKAAEADFPDGCLFFDMLGHTAGMPALSSHDMLGRLLRILDVPGERIPGDPDGRAILYRDQLRERKVLLVLDNARTAAQVRPLLPAGSTCRVLVTSRTRLAALDDARHILLPPLAEADAIALFTAIAGGHGDSVAAIVRGCGRLPLAVRVAAARLLAGGWSAEELRERLADESTRLSALDDGERSVAAAFRLSYEHLDDDERRAFALLAIHPGTDIDVQAMAALTGRPRAVTDRTVDRLHDAHLVVRRPGGYIHRHDLLVSFAGQVLGTVTAAERAAALHRLLEHVVGKVHAADRALEPDRYRPPDLPEAISGFTGSDDATAWLRAHWPTLVEMVDLAADPFPDLCWQLAYLLRAFFFNDGLTDVWVRSHRTALVAAARAADVNGLGIILNSLGMAHHNRAELDAAADCHRRALDEFTRRGNTRGVVDATASLAWVSIYQGDYEPALRDLLTALGTYRHVGRERNEMITLRGLVLAAAALGRHAEALDYANAALRLARTPHAELLATTCVAWARYQAGDMAGAATAYTASIDLAEQRNLPAEAARARTGLANTAAVGGDWATARMLWAEADAEALPLNPRLIGEAAARGAVEGRSGADTTLLGG